MYDCNCLIHPFQNDPGTSQNERVMEELLAGTIQIDARTLADLLQYFVELSRHINYYDSKLNVGDWQLFFKNSIPFTLASAIKSKPDQLQNNLTYYQSLFEKKPSSTGLQLQAYYIFYHGINKLNDWYLSVKNSGLPIEKSLEILIKDKLQQPLKSFIGYTNAAVKWYGIKRIDFLKFHTNEVWDIELNELYIIDTAFKNSTNSDFKRLSQLYQSFKKIAFSFFDAIKNASLEAEKSLGQSLLPLKEELQKKHPPHLGLLFVFLNLFRHLQDDLNRYTKKHLDFFYKDVLQLKPREAIADKAHVIFEIQKQLSNYLLKKGLLLKDGKDINKQQILFSLDDDILVNKTEVAQIRTLFLNNQILSNPTEDTVLLEGAYIAPDATKADGIDKDFQTGVRDFYTLGNKESKYILPGTNAYKPYPNARLGFVLASPVLLLNEGTRTVSITLNCTLDERICDELARLVNPAKENCCDGNANTEDLSLVSYPHFFPASEIYADIAAALNTEYYYINETLIADGIKKGLDSKTVLVLQNFLISSNENIRPKTYCYCPTEIKKYDAVVSKTEFESKIDVGSEIVAAFFKKRKPFTILFSGEKEWIEPGEVAAASFDIIPNVFSNQFSFVIQVVINAEKPAVSFFDKEKLKEDFGTILPLVKIELDDHFKIFQDDVNRENTCCIDKDLKYENNRIPVSLYHFFRNVKIQKDSKIDVKVCGLKNFIVQNDESLQNVNGPVFPFGVRPTLNSGFYIGCKEVLYKDWEACWININWKDRPDDLQSYYQGYQNTITNTVITDFDNENFEVEKSLLNQGNWQPDLNDKLLPPSITSGKPKKHNTLCTDSENKYELHLSLLRNEYPQYQTVAKELLTENIKDYNVNSRNGFIRLTLKNNFGVDFQHSNYPFILGRQMMAFGKLPKETVDGAVYYDPVAGNPIVFSSDDIKNDIGAAKPITDRVVTDVNDPITNDGIAQHAKLAGNIPAADAKRIRTILYPNSLVFPGGKDLIGDTEQLKTLVDKVNLAIGDIAKYAAIIPSEPWTPVISNMAIDYTATATMKDIQLVHLYPFAETYKHEEIQLQPTLFPTLCDEGSLFLGLANLVPGQNLNLLFQLAEATSDSESVKEQVYWHYLDNNIWKPLREGFELLNDATQNLTTSGIVTFALPENMTSDNTIMPGNIYWIKASIAKNSKAVSETTGIHSQAAAAAFTNDAANDKLRLNEPLAAQSIAKLNEADANVKAVQQPYASFGGRLPEIEGQFYVRVSEQLRHKGRAIQKFDYERLVLDAFPQLFKVKCINHSFALDAHFYKNDFPYAPGYVILAVIPDLYQLKAGNSFEPKVPVSIIEKIDAYIRKRSSPFVRFRSMNPRYEKINLCLRVKLMLGKNENFFREKLIQDLKELLAPWAVGQYDKLTFGQCVYRSDIIRFVESREYVDFITGFKMAKASEIPDDQLSKICPDTPRSILVAGNIEVCIEPPECEKWIVCGDPVRDFKTDCCNTELVPIAQYCKDKNQ